LQPIAAVGPIAVGVADINRDTYPDLVSANYGSNNVSLLLNNGNGTFAVPVNFDVGNLAMALILGGFDNNGLQDIAVTNTQDNTVSILLAQCSP
jgi:hypothetical protein